MTPESSVNEIKGVGDRTKEAFARLHVLTVSDLLTYYPRTYLQYPKAERLSDEGALAEGRHAVLAQPFVSAVNKNGRIPVTLLSVSEGGRSLQLIWYRMPYIKSYLKAREPYVFYGNVVIKNKRATMEQPRVFSPEEYAHLQDRLTPVYALTAGLSQKTITKCVRTVFSENILLPDELPAGVRREYGLCEINYAIRQMHFPDSADALADAKKRLVFDEFFYFILQLSLQKDWHARLCNPFSFTNPSYMTDLAEKLPFALTGAQKRVLGDIASDLSGAHLMQRLLQGDVGSGKTVVAYLTMAWTAECGYQSALMVPTEVLARQHYETFQKLSEMLHVDAPLLLLTGSLSAKEKKDVYERMRRCQNAMIIGTHALIQQKALYDTLALVITDEQHRFGVQQREALSDKGEQPHVLAMSATPIPRTQAVILYGDLDISVLDEVPKNRLPVKNCLVSPAFRSNAYRFIEGEVRAGHQAIIICPFVEASESMQGENVTDYSRMLSEHLPADIKIGTLHGRMKDEKKERVTEEFAAGEIDVLVSTTVVEVGIDVPNATVMMIENAERFGLAQLHQLRGRVGRGAAQSYCIFVDGSGGQKPPERLSVMCRSDDGFYLAAEDLRIRGPGDFFGTAQSGETPFVLADIYEDAEVLQQASDAVKTIRRCDPQLKKEEDAGLMRRMKRESQNQKARMEL